MCAIAGILGLPSDSQTIDGMLETMSRRGPDAKGLFQERNCSLLHRRLAIIDPDGGQQPMTLNQQGEVYTIVYNGELYNTQEIRQELLKLGHQFSGHSDTEVVLHAYAQWAEKALERFNGIFAFAVWEQCAGRLFLARDRIGVKPLFYTKLNDGILFASEIKTILAHPQMKAQIDEEGIAELLLIGPGRTPGSGVFKGIQELEPGCYGVFENGSFSWRRYWKLTDREHTDAFEQTAEHVRYLVTDAIKRQMISDVPIGTFLSGGLDSSIISAVCAKEALEQGSVLPTFSVDYENNEKYFVPGKFQPNSDSMYIAIMRRYLGTDHHTTVIDPEQLFAALEQATKARDLPGMADVDFSLLVFCGDIRKKVKVALSGECADEIFGGYPWYRDPEIRAFAGFPWAQNTQERATFILSDAINKTVPAQYVQDRYLQTIRQCDILPGISAQERRMKEMVNLNQRWFMQTLLDRKDRMSMYHGLEVRVPFCDYRIAEYMYGVPWEYKDYRNREKGLLRYAVNDLLPQEIVHRKKSPYPKTHDPKYLTMVSDRLRDVISDPAAPILQIVSKTALSELLTAQYTWPWYGQLMRVPQTIAYMLQINYWFQEYQVQIV